MSHNSTHLSCSPSNVCPKHVQCTINQLRRRTSMFQVMSTMFLSCERALSGCWSMTRDTAAPYIAATLFFCTHDTPPWSINPLTSQWCSQECELGESLDPFPFLSPLLSPPLPFSPSLLSSFLPIPFPPVKSRNPKIQPGGMGECCELPQRGLGRSTAEVEFCA